MKMVDISCFSFYLGIAMENIPGTKLGGPPRKMGLFEFTNGRSIHRGFCICSTAWVFTTTQSESSVIFIWERYEQRVMNWVMTIEKRIPIHI